MHAAQPLFHIFPPLSACMTATEKKKKIHKTPLTNPSPAKYSYSASQADVAVFKALKEAPNAAKHPAAARWYKHIATYEDEFATLEGDASKPYTVYGPEVAEVTLNPAKAPAAEEDDDVDLFGSDDEEEDAEAARVREERLAAYREKKAAKPKVAAKSVVTLDVKPWGTFFLLSLYSESISCRYWWRFCRGTMTGSFFSHGW